MNRVLVRFPRHGAEEGGYAVLLMDPRSGITIGLHRHEANPGQPFHESRTGLDHISGAAGRADLDAWARWPGELGIEHSGVIFAGRRPAPWSSSAIPATSSSSSSTWPADRQNACRTPAPGTTPPVSPAGHAPSAATPGSR